MINKKRSVSFGGQSFKKPERNNIAPVIIEEL